MHSRIGRIKKSSKKTQTYKHIRFKENLPNRATEKEQGRSLQNIMLGHLDIHLEKKLIWALLHIADTKITSGTSQNFM